MSSGARHLVIRYSDSGYGPPEGTVAAHIAICSAAGEVAVAKFGRPVGPAAGLYFSERAEEGTPSRLFLVGLDGKELHHAAVGEVVRVREHCRPDDLGDLVPGYYPRSQEGTFFILQNLRPLRVQDMASYVVQSSGRDFLEVATRSWQSMFWITEKGPHEKAQVLLPGPSGAVRSEEGRKVVGACSESEEARLLRRGCREPCERSGEIAK